MATAPSADETERLGESDLYEVVEALLDAKDRACDFGLALKLQPGEVRSIYMRYRDDPQECLTALMEYYLKQVNPIPNWRAIAGALRSPVVNLPRLAERVEATKLSNTTSATLLHQNLDASVMEPLSRPLGDLQGQLDTVRKAEVETGLVQQSALAGPSSAMKVDNVKEKIKHFEKRFNQFKWATRDTLKEKNIPVKKIVDTLADLPADDVPEHKMFLEGFLTILYQAGDQVELFGTLNTHVNYLSYHLVDHLINEFNLDIKSEMEKYKDDLKEFMEKLPLMIFCKTQTKRRVRPTDEFVEMVAEFKWPKDVTLEIVEQFRKEYACHYKLRDCAMMVAEIRPCSFVVVWYIPRSIAEKLQNEVPRDILRKYSATTLEINGCCVFKEQLSPDESDKKMKQKTLVYAGLNRNDEKSDEEEESLIGLGGARSLLKFKRLVLKISTHLLEGDVQKISYIYNVPHHDSLEVLNYLEFVGYFSYSNAEPLQSLLGNISRYDLAMLVKDFIVKESKCSSVYLFKTLLLCKELNLEEVHDRFAAKCVAVEEDFQELWKRDKLTKEEGMKFLRKGKKLLKEHEAVIEKSEEKLMGVMPASPDLSSSSSSSSLEVSTGPEPTPTTLSAGEQERREGRRNRDKPCPKPRRPNTPPPYQPPAQESAQAVLESTIHTSPMLRASSSHDLSPPIPPKSPMLKRATHKPSLTSKMCYTKPAVCVQVQRKESDERIELAVEECDPGGDSGLESGSGSVQHGTITEWREAIKNPPPEPKPQHSGHEYTPINLETKDEERVYVLPRKELDPKY